MKKILFTFTFLVFLVGCDLENPGGVLTSNQIPTSVFEFIDKKNILDDENIIAYYDVSLVLNNSESAIITNKNVIYYKQDRVMKFPLNEIQSIDNEERGIIGLSIFVTSIDGRIMTITIAPLNGGDLFLDLLKKEAGKNRYN